MTAKLKRGITKVKDPGSALTHFIAMILAIIAAIPLLSKAGHDSGHMHISALAIFILSMIGLYAASTIYHTLDISPKINKLLRKIDHMMIYILIAGNRLDHADPGVGHCHCGYPYQRSVDYMPQMVFIPDLHCHGMGVHTGYNQNIELHAQGRLHVASGRRYHLYSGRYYLCHEASVLQLPPQIFWFP